MNARGQVRLRQQDWANIGRKAPRSHTTKTCTNMGLEVTAAPPLILRATTHEPDEHTHKKHKKRPGARLQVLGWWVQTRDATYPNDNRIREPRHTQSLRTRELTDSNGKRNKTMKNSRKTGGYSMSFTQWKPAWALRGNAMTRGGQAGNRHWGSKPKP